jgi:hypothetical protein
MFNSREPRRDDRQLRPGVQRNPKLRPPQSISRDPRKGASNQAHGSAIVGDSNCPRLLLQLPLTLPLLAVACSFVCHPVGICCRCRCCCCCAVAVAVAVVVARTKEPRHPGRSFPESHHEQTTPETFRQVSLSNHPKTCQAPNHQNPRQSRRFACPMSFIPFAIIDIEQQTEEALAQAGASYL